jgi:hypothetical protein
MTSQRWQSMQRCSGGVRTMRDFTSSNDAQRPAFGAFGVSFGEGSLVLDRGKDPGRDSSRYRRADLSVAR